MCNRGLQRGSKAGTVAKEQTQTASLRKWLLFPSSVHCTVSFSAADRPMHPPAA